MLPKILIATAIAAPLTFAAALAPAPVSFATPAAAQCSIYQGGECGRDARFLNNEPRWRGGYGYLDRNIGHGNRGGYGNHGGGYRSGGGGSVTVYTYERRTCRDWVQPGGVGPKIYIGPPRAC